LRTLQRRHRSTQEKRRTILKLSFLNREKELARLTKSLKSKDPVFIVLYGRRRTGKSTLLQKVVGPHDIYYCADQRASPLQIDDLAKQIARIVPGFSDAHYPSWDVLLKTFDSRVSQKTTLVLDELPYLVQMAPEIPSMLQKFTDKKHRTSIVVCGSSQRMMQGLILDASAPLYGRADEIIRLYPLKPGWIQGALGAFGAEGIEAYSVWGGTPRYWELAQGHATLMGAAKELLFDRNGPLHEEPARLLMDDAQSSVQANSLLSIIANGCNKISEIAARLQIQSTSLARPLSNLIDLGYIKREIPFGESIKTTKRSLYKINDPFLSYWHKFIQPNRSLLEMGLIDEVYDDCKKKIPFHTASVWEDLARESTGSLTIEKLSWKPGKRWWGAGKSKKPMEIDILAESFDGKALLFGEAKWDENGDAEALFAKLDRCINDFPVTKGKTIFKALWLKKKDAKRNKGGTVFTPEDVLNALK
jgi:hypothetical protein